MGTFPKLSLSGLFKLAAGVLVLGHIAATASEVDPYRTLGVSRHASQAEVKKAYKDLAKEWHPDKNKHPQAEDMFIKITKSYEILSNKERRANYDRYGQMDENEPHSQAHHGFHSFHDSFYFDQSFFQFTQSTRDFTDNKHLLNYAQYVNNVVPDSFKKPYLIKITSEWCFACIHIEPVWKQTVQELEHLGVGFGVVDIGFEKRLLNLLGAHRAPAILGLINGRVFTFHNAYSAEYLKQFVESLLPQKLVQKVTDDNYIQFLDGWKEENKPSVLLLHSMSSPPLLYKLAAFAYRDFVRFGYVDHTEGVRVTQQFKIKLYAPTMLLFKENTEKPADSIQSRGIKRQTMEEFISHNRFLLVPRLVNQKLFEELCPIKQLHRPRRYCVLLITGEDEALYPANAAFYDFASSNTKESLRFAYVHHKQQQALCNELLKKEDLSPPQVIILERKSSTGKVLYHMVKGGWNGSDEDKTLLYERLEVLQRDPAFFTHDAMLPELNNELASMFLVRWVNSAYDYLSQAYFDLLYSNWSELMPILTLICSAVFIMFASIIVQAFSDSGEEKMGKQKSKASPKRSKEPTYEENSSSYPHKKNSAKVCELTEETYTSNLTELNPGQINVVLLLTDASKHVLLHKFAQEVCSFLQTPSLHFSFINLSKHRQWLDSLLQMVPEARLSDLDEEASSSSYILDYAGHVLACNGHKKYFCMYSPHGSESNIRQLHHRMDRLSLWLERLIEGSLPRHHVPTWPDIDSSSSKEKCSK